jgi:hypothetical protein
MTTSEEFGEEGEYDAILRMMTMTITSTGLKILYLMTLLASTVHSRLNVFGDTNGASAVRRERHEAKRQISLAHIKNNAALKY